MNIFTFSGHLGNDAAQRFTQSGQSIVQFSVPVKSGYGDKAKTTWVKCSLFGKRGEGIFPYLLKGQHVGVSGEFSMDEWEGKDGTKKVDAACNVQNVELMGKRTEGQAASKPQEKPKAGAFDDSDSEIPF